jgi:HKD family nuclease
MILDPNQNAFGSEKIGLPNLPVAAEFEKLGDENISIRWYKTDKEQFHTKLMMIQKADETVILGGSANYTSRNLDDYNLEANVEIHAPNDADVSKDVDSYFHRLWTNQNGTYTVDYSEYQKKLPVFKYLTYRIQKVFRFTTY